MIALGWTWPGVRPPERVKAHSRDGLTLLSCPGPSDPRRIMALQLACIEKELDLVPIAPTAGLSVQDALAFDPKPVRAALRHIAGCVQFTLTTDRVRPSDTATTGRAWLAARKANHDRATDITASLQQIASGVGALDLRVRTTGNCVTCDILTTRRSLGQISARLKEAARAQPTRHLTNPMMTGPWPAYSFVQLPQLEPA